jgi:hypothetical protein
MREQWDELKETIIELRDNNGTATQQEVCKFLFNLMNVLETQTTADVVEIVRCKDCKHYRESEADPNRKMCCRRDVDGWSICYDFYSTDYCSYGERRTDE